MSPTYKLPSDVAAEAILLSVSSWENLFFAFGDFQWTAQRISPSLTMD